MAAAGLAPSYAAINLSAVIRLIAAPSTSSGTYVTQREWDIRRVVSRSAERDSQGDRLRGDCHTTEAVAHIIHTHPHTHPSSIRTTNANLRSSDDVGGRTREEGIETEKKGFQNRPDRGASHARRPCRRPTCSRLLSIRLRAARGRRASSTRRRGGSRCRSFGPRRRRTGAAVRGHSGSHTDTHCAGGQTRASCTASALQTAESEIVSARR